jgi:hypothetical protein
MPPSDVRNWETIRAWASDLATKLQLALAEAHDTLYGDEETSTLQEGAAQQRDVCGAKGRFICLRRTQSAINAMPTSGYAIWGKVVAEALGMTAELLGQ